MVGPADDRAVDHVEAAVIFGSSWERRQKSREVTAGHARDSQQHS